MIFSYIVAFTCIWWVIFYMTLPFGIRKIAPTKLGYDSGAPKKPNLEIKIIIASIIAFILTASFIYLLEHGYIRKFVDGYVKWLSISY